MGSLRESVPLRSRYPRRRPCGSAHARHGSNEWIVRSTSSGRSGSAIGLPISEASYGPFWPFSSRGTGVPGRRDDGLVVRDLAVLDHDPVRQRAARRLVEAEAALLALGEDRLVEDRRCRPWRCCRRAAPSASARGRRSPRCGRRAPGGGRASSGGRRARAWSSRPRPRCRARSSPTSSWARGPCA